MKIIYNDLAAFVFLWRSCVAVSADWPPLMNHCPVSLQNMREGMLPWIPP